MPQYPFAPSAFPNVVFKTGVSAVASLILVGCGGSSSSPPSTSPTSSNLPPTASAGADASSNILPSGQPLDGSGSRDPDGDSLRYQWSVSSQPEGGGASFVNASEQSTNFTANAPGEYVLTLTVTDPSGASSSDSVTYSLANQAPVLSLSGYEGEGFVGAPNSLDVSGSTDSNGQMLRYMWEISSAPTDSGLMGQTFNEAIPGFSFDAPGDYTVEVTASDGFASDTQSLTFSISQFEILPLQNEFTDAEFDSVNNRIVALHDNMLTIIDSEGDEKAITLPLAGSAVSIAPDGNFAAVAHNAFISHIDLNTASILNTHSVPAELGDIVLDGNGFAHGFPQTGQWVRVSTVNMETGAVTSSDGRSTRHRSKAKLHPSGTKIYAANNGLSPSDVERYTINADAVTLEYDSPYHGDFPFCGDLWMGPSGNNFLSRCGVVVRASDDPATDMTYVMQLEIGSLVHASSSDFSGLWHTISTSSRNSGRSSNSIQVFDSGNGNLNDTLILPDSDFGSGLKWFGRYVFSSNNSDGIFVLAADDSSPPNYALIKQYATASSASDFAPVAKSSRYITARASENVVLDGSASSDPENKSLSYSWMLMSEPEGSAVLPTGLDSSTARFSPTVEGVYEFSLRVSNGERQSNIQKVSVSVFGSGDDLVHRVEGGIADAEYSSSLDALIYLSDNSSDLHILDLTDLTTTSVPLEQTPYRVGVSPDGNFAAVSHAGTVSLVDLQTESVIDMQSYSADWGDVVLDRNNRAHIVPRRDQWVEFHSIDFAQNSTSERFGARAGTQIRMHPTQDWVYGANRGLSPSDFEKWDVSEVPTKSVGDSPYHGDYPISGNIWISEGGNKLLVASGRLFNSDSDQEVDMRYAGALSDGPFVIWANHSKEADQWAVVPSQNATEIKVYSDDFFTLQSTIAVAEILSSTGGVEAEGHQVFHSENGDTVYILSKAEGLSDSFAIQIVR